MKPALSLVSFVTVILAGTSPALAQDSWVGKRIIMKKNGVEIRTTDKGAVEKYVKLTFLDYMVLADRDGEVQVNDQRGNMGWFDKDDAVVLDGAVAYFSDQIRRDPMNAGAYHRRAAAWSIRGEPDKAIEDYDELLRLTPHSAAIYNNRGLAWNIKKDYDKAITDFNEAIRRDPAYVPAYYDRAKAWRAKKDFDKAIADYNEAVRLDPKFGNAYNARAWVWATCADAKYRNGKKAVESAKQALALEPKSANHMHTLAAAYAESGDFAEAVRWQEKALADPQFRNNADYRRRLELYRDKKPYRQE